MARASRDRGSSFTLDEEHMFVRYTKDLIGRYGPSRKEKAVFAISLLPAALIGFHIVRASSWGRLDSFDFAVFAFMLLASAGYSEMNLRTVVVDEEKMTTASPLRLYRQHLRHEALDGARLTHMGRGFIAEVCYHGRWIVFPSNETFRERIRRA